MVRCGGVGGGDGSALLMFDEGLPSRVGVVGGGTGTSSVNNWLLAELLS